jgi:hypothetical protein
MEYLVEYMKIHLVSIEQDLEDINNQMEALDPNSKDYIELDFEYNYLSGQAIATRHFLSVANDRMKA